jgi:hypothetical protein
VKVLDFPTKDYFSNSPLFGAIYSIICDFFQHIKSSESINRAQIKNYTLTAL